MPASYNEVIRSGVEAAKAGQRNDAYKFFLEAIRLNPRDARGWLYLAHVSPTKEHKRKALETVLQLDPSNAKAQELLQGLTSDTAAQPLQSQTDSVPRSAITPSGRKRQIVYVTLLILAVIIVGVIIVAIVVTQSNDAAEQKEFLVRMCLLEDEDHLLSECEEVAEEVMRYFSAEIAPCYSKYSDSMELFKRCLEEPLERRINQSNALNTYCVYVLYPSCREQMCTEVPGAVTTQCGNWTEDIGLNYRGDVDRCWAAFTPPEHDWYTWYMGEVMSDELDPFGKCVEENAKSVPPMN